MWLSGSDSVVGNSYDYSRNILEADRDGGIYITDGSAVARIVARKSWIFSNLGRGIFVENGTDISLIQNDIWDNLDHAIYLDAYNSDVWGNRLGTAAGASGHGGSGIVVANYGNIISDNTIGHSLLDGIRFDGDDSEIRGNWIGVGRGYEDAGNAIEGIRLRGSSNHFGDPAMMCAAYPSGFNGSDGIQIEGEFNIIRDNYLGGIKTESIAVSFENNQRGVLLTAGAANNTLRGNNIRYNGDHGVRVNATAGNGNAIRMNEFFSNGGMAIDLQLDGPKPNDPGDNDTGPK